MLTKNGELNTKAAHPLKVNIGPSSSHDDLNLLTPALNNEVNGKETKAVSGPNNFGLQPETETKGRTHHTLPQGSTIIPLLEGDLCLRLEDNGKQAKEIDDSYDAPDQEPMELAEETTQSKMGIHIAKELKRFASTTSMKGLPRAAKAESPGVRSAWCMVVVAFLVISLYQTYLLLSSFFKHEKFTQVTEIPINPLDTTGSDVIPEIAICNLNPLSSNISRYQGIPTFKEYLDMMKTYTECQNCSADLKVEMNRYKSGVLTYGGYWQYIGRENAWDVGHQMADFIVSCQSRVADGLHIKSVPCTEIMTVTQFQTFEYFNCVNLRVNRETNLTGVRGLSIVTYLDSFDEDIDFPYGLGNYIGQSVGAMFIVHESMTVSLTQKGQPVMPGTLTEVRLSLERRERLEPPYGTCVQHYENGDFIYLERYNVTIKKTRLLCLSECISDHIIEQCGCVDLHQIVLRFNKSLPLCGDPKLGAEEMLNKTACASILRNARAGWCATYCETQCVESIFHAETHQSVWPRTRHLRAFYNHYIADKPYKDRFQILRNISSINSTLTDIFLAERLVRDNFLQLSLSLKDFSYIQLKDTPKTDFPSLLSQIGGSLNLWSGITVFCIVEIVECLYRIFTNCKSQDHVKEINI